MKHILVIEDCFDIQEILVPFLEGEGYRVSVAGNGQDALTFLKKGDKPNLILLDLMMPRMDGFEFRKEQEKLAEAADVPIVIMTADSHIQDKLKRVRGCGYLLKPFQDLDLIISTVEKCLKSKSDPNGAPGRT